MLSKAVYLDNLASTPCDPRVVEVMLPFFLEVYGNASSGSHGFGRAAADAVARAREAVASLFEASPADVVFTSGATESNNLAIRGIAAASPPGRRRLLVGAGEHKCVLETAAELGRVGWEIESIPVLSDGRVDLNALETALDERVALVSIQAINNEVGVIQPVSEAAALAHGVGAFLHCDGAQAVGKVPVGVEAAGADALSLSAHKAYGPKGVGALLLRGGRRQFPIVPQQTGGGQEDGLRAGTLNVPGIVGMAEAFRLASQERETDMARLGRLRDALDVYVLGAAPGSFINARNAPRAQSATSISFPGVDADALMARLPGFAISSGSACTSGTIAPSHVLLAMGLSREAASGTIRVGLGRFTSDRDVESFGYALCDTVSELQRLGPITAAV